MFMVFTTNCALVSESIAYHNFYAVSERLSIYFISVVLSGLANSITTQQTNLIDHHWRLFLWVISTELFKAYPSISYRWYVRMWITTWSTKNLNPAQTQGITNKEKESKT